ncbi:MAG: LacI family DNA-binding transcriptional regulator [Chloroflexota bacterium]
MTVSIKDIAQRANVAPSTVSRALKNHPRISEQMRQQIQTLAKEMGYVPSEAARRLVGQASPTIGVAIPDFTDPFYMNMLGGIEEVAIAHNHELFVGSFNRDRQRERKLFDAFDQKRLAGIVVAGSLVDDAFLNHKPTDVPAVLVNHYKYPFSVAVDQKKGVAKAVNHLISLGHRHIAYVSLGTLSSSDRLRFEGYKETIEAAGLPADPRWVVAGDGGITGGLTAVSHLLTLSVPPTAIICYNDRTAIGVIHSLHQHGHIVPEDISVVGFDDLEIAEYFLPPLTTVRQPHAHLGRQAAEKLFALIHGASVQAELLEPELIRRGSTGSVNSKQ